MNEYIKGWEEQPEKIRELTDKGVVPMMKDMEDEKDVDMPFLMGQVAAMVKDVKPAREIVEDMVREAVQMITLGQSYIAPGAKSKL
jgi:hypothetical protein